MTINDIELYDEDELDIILDSISPSHSNILKEIIDNLCKQVSDRETFIQILLKLYYEGKEDNFKDLDTYLNKINLNNQNIEPKQDYGSLVRKYYDYLWRKCLANEIIYY